MTKYIFKMSQIIKRQKPSSADLKEHFIGKYLEQVFSVNFAKFSRTLVLHRTALDNCLNKYFKILFKMWLWLFNARMWFRSSHQRSSITKLNFIQFYSNLNTLNTQWNLYSIYVQPPWGMLNKLAAFFQVIKFSTSIRSCQKNTSLLFHIVNQLENIYTSNFTMQKRDVILSSYVNMFLLAFKMHMKAKLKFKATKKTRSTETKYLSRHRTCSIRKGVLRNFAKFLRKHLCQSLFFNV